ncbi:MAG: hypothetical protein ACFFGZ_16235, partial [Candidatus Thorarchaeota archaeon]
TFLTSWMLSMLVRYQPKAWQQILSGTDDDIINRIRDFRRNNIPGTIRSFLRDYYREDSYDREW